MCPLQLVMISAEVHACTYHQYSPPEVGIAEPRSAMASPTMKINIEATNQPQTIPTGPAGIEKARVEAIEGSKPMMEKAIPNTSIIVKLRRSSCLYPSLAILGQENSVKLECGIFGTYPIAQHRLRLRGVPVGRIVASTATSPSPGA